MIWLYQFIKVGTREISFKNVFKKLQGHPFTLFIPVPLAAKFLVRKVMIGMSVVVLETG